jgi:DegV family protein with EDD domain
MSRVSSVAVVTDSTSYLPDGVAEDLGITVVPLGVELAGRLGREGVDVLPGDVTAALREKAVVTTSRPAPEEFRAVYEAALAKGHEHVVSVHLSAELSGTYDSARLAAAEMPPSTVTVVDSRMTAMGLGFAVMAAGRAASFGAASADVVATAQATSAGTYAVFYVDSLEWLHRGGRIGTAATMVGTALSVKPLLHLDHGRIVPLAKVRTASKGIAKLVEVAVAAAGSGPVELAVQHLAAPERAAEVTETILKLLDRPVQVYASEVGAVVGAHCGPGLLGVVIRRW